MKTNSNKPIPSPVEAAKPDPVMCRDHEWLNFDGKPCPYCVEPVEAAKEHRGVTKADCPICSMEPDSTMPDQKYKAECGAKQSTSLPQQGAGTELYLSGKGFAALPQQEEPATYGCGACDSTGGRNGEGTCETCNGTGVDPEPEQKSPLEIVGEMREILDAQMERLRPRLANDWNCPTCDGLAKPCSCQRPIPTPLLGQDESECKMQNEWCSVHESWREKHCKSHYRGILLKLGEALTSLAAAQKELEMLKGTNQDPALCGVCKKEHITFWPCDYESKLAAAQAEIEELKKERRFDSVQRVDTWAGSKVVHCEFQDHQLCLWIEIDPDGEFEIRKFIVVGTGHPVPDGAKWVGTAQNSPFVWHVYEVSR